MQVIENTSVFWVLQKMWQPACLSGPKNRNQHHKNVIKNGLNLCICIIFNQFVILYFQKKSVLPLLVASFSILSGTGQWFLDGHEYLLVNNIIFNM